MTDTALLNDYIKKCGIKKGKLAELLGLSFGSFSRKVHNKDQFKANEIQALCSFLGIKDSDARDHVFFAQNVHCDSTEVTP